MKLDKLAKMHLLLREKGWEPEIQRSGSSWEWRHSGNRTKVGNLRRRAAVLTTFEMRGGWWEFRTPWDKDVVETSPGARP
jgi:hypothetical protein